MSRIAKFADFALESVLMFKFTVLCNSETTEQLDFMKISRKFQYFLLLKITGFIYHYSSLFLN
jgi:predicted ATPase